MFRFLFFPIALLYGIVVAFRNLFYKIGILPTARFEIPIILVGNLTTGGTGKTPHVDYLVKLLGNRYKLAILSRGYGRRTKGYREVDTHSSVWESGDEPLLYKTRHPELTVTVCEDRAEGIRTIMKLHPEVQVIIMDDGFQHRRVQPGFSILLTAWQTPFFKDYLLPVGNLREFRSGRHRANCVVVTRTPENAVNSEKEQVIRDVAMSDNRNVFFSSIGYSSPKAVFPATAPEFPTGILRPLVFAGIANAEKFVEHVTLKYGTPDVVIFDDHHDYNEKELEDLFERYQERLIMDKNSVLITTEKDAMRLRTGTDAGVLKQLPLFYIPIDIILHPIENSLDQRILDYVAKNQRNSRLYS